MKNYSAFFFSLVFSISGIAQSSNLILVDYSDILSDTLKVDSLVNTSTTNDTIIQSNTQSDSTEYTDSSQIVMVEERDEATPEIHEIPKEILLTLKVVDSVTNLPIEATVHTLSFGNTRGRTHKGEGVCDKSGRFQFKLMNTSVVELNIVQQGYHRYTLLVDIQKEQYQEPLYNKLCKLSPFQKGDIVVLDNINFKQGDDQLLPSSHPTLDKLILMMEANPHMVIQLNGHTETTGSYNSMMKLSQKRVNSVRFYLIQNGIKVSRIKSVGYGGTNPIYTGKDPEKQRTNRRVELEIVKI